MKIGDKVKMSDKNLNHLENDVCAYAGMEGIVTDIWDDNSFSIRCENSSLTVTMQNTYRKKTGVWIYLNGKLTWHKRIDKKPTTSPKKWYMWFIPDFNQ